MESPKKLSLQEPYKRKLVKRLLTRPGTIRNQRPPK